MSAAASARSIRSIPSRSSSRGRRASSGAACAGRASAPSLPCPADMPYAAASGYTYDAADCLSLFDTALRTADEPGFAARRAASEANGKRRGFGLSCHLHGTGGIADEHVVVDVQPDRLVARIGTQSQGQGHETVFAQLLSQALGVSME